MSWWGMVCSYWSWAIIYAYIGETNWGGGNAHWDCWAMHRLEARGPAGQEHHLSQCCWVGLLLEVFCFFSGLMLSDAQKKSVHLVHFQDILEEVDQEKKGSLYFWEFLRAVPLTHLDLLDPVGSDRNHRPLDAASDAAPGSATHGHVS